MKIKLKQLNKKNKSKKVKVATFNLVEVIIIILMTSLVVGVSTGVVVYKNHSKIDFSNSDKSTYFDELETAYNHIMNNFVEDIEEEDIVSAAIEGMYNYLGDPYTSYLDKDTTSDLVDRLNGEYKGIGVEIVKVETGIQLVTVFDNGPAAKAGLKAGDVLIKIDGKDITSNTAAEVSNMIKNYDKRKIEVSFIRDGITKTATIEVTTVYIPSVASKNINGIGYIYISTFADPTFSQFKEALLKLENEGITGLVIDVRDNGGGYLNTAVAIAELFIEEGKTIYGLETKESTTFYEDKTSAKRDYKVGVLINGGSASASEMLAAALSESYGATIIGNVSYGKGTVQETAELGTGGMIKYTTAYWLTPKGTKINNVGIKPDIEVNASYNETLTIEEDVQLQTALNAVK